MTIQPGVGYTFTASSQGTNLNIQQPWAPYPLYGETFECAPFLVHDVKLRTGGGGGTFVNYEICPGVVNNLMPGVYDVTSETWQYLDALPEDYELRLDFGGTSSCYVYLRLGPDATTKVFPKPIPENPDEDPYPRIYSTGATFPVDTNELAYVKIAKVTTLSEGVYRVDQYVTGSLWADRIQIGAGETMKSYYYYARI